MKTPQEQKAEYDRLYNLLHRLSSKSEEPIPLASILNGSAEAPAEPPLEKESKKKKASKAPITQHKEGSVLSFLFRDEPRLSLESSPACSNFETVTNLEPVEILKRNVNLEFENEEPASRPADEEVQARPEIASPENCENDPKIQTHSVSQSSFELVKSESHNLLEVMMTKKTRKPPQKEPKPPKEKPPKEPKSPKEPKPPKEPRRARATAALPRVFVLEEPLLSPPISAPSSVPSSTDELPVSLYLEDIMIRAITGEFSHQCRFCKTLFSSSGQHRMHYYHASACNRNAIQEVRQMFLSK